MNSCETNGILPKRTAQSLCLVLSIMLTGCFDFDTKQEFTLNPDGSGKVVHECRFDDRATIHESVDSNASLKKAVRELIQKSKGVDTWRDVTFSRLDDGRAYFRGTAYFRRLDDLDIDEQMALHFVWMTRPDGTRVLAKAKKRGPTNADLFRDFSGGQKSLGTNPSPAAVAKCVRDQQAQYLVVRPMYEQMFGRTKHEVTFKLPGTVSKTSIFTSTANNQLAVAFDGTNTLMTLDKLVNDGESFKRTLMTNALANLREATEEEGNAFIFGKKARLEATVSAGKNPLFDYDAEVQAAQSGFAKLQKDLQMTVASVMPAAGAGFKSLHIVGIHADNSFPKQKGFNTWWRDPGLTLTLVGELPGTVQAVSKNGVVKTALCNNGSSLLPDSAEDREIGACLLSTNKTAVLFQVSLKLPDKNARVLNELSGQLQYHSEVGAKEIDLGFDKLREGARGKELGAYIKSIKPHWDRDALLIEVSLNLRLEAIKDVYLVAGETRTLLPRTMNFGGGEVSTIGLVSKWTLPPDGRLVVHVVDRVQPFDVPFKLQNIPLPNLELNL